MDTVNTPRILMCPPDYFGIEYEINPWMNVRVGSDTERSRRQWNALRRHSAGAGCRGRSDRPGPGPARPGLHGQRRAWSTATGSSARGSGSASARVRPRYFEDWARRLGFEVVNLAGGLALRGGRRCLVLRRDALRRLSIPQRRAEPPVGRRAAGRRGPADGAGRPPVLPPGYLLLPAGAGLGALLPGRFRRLWPFRPARPDPEPDRGRGRGGRSRSVATRWSSAGRSFSTRAHPSWPPP